MLRRPSQSVVQTLTDAGATSLRQLDTLVDTTTATVDTYITPVRKSVAQRYPGLFSVLATFGAAATFLGFEQILLTSTLIQRHPFFILCIGIGVLSLTGTLYKKLS